ncbi:response regulator [Actinoplanes sp. NPDC049548]|uniref:response regulator transcription factor n=1 Tax=Actinoplanes sp. NPDC049548 TaxID=3155152 RepID=UPI0034122094
MSPASPRTTLAPRTPEAVPLSAGGSSTPDYVPTILVADDDEAIRDLITVKLERADYRVLTADNGAAALHIVEKQLPDAVILDISMPDLDGLEVCYRMQTLRATVDIPVLIVSSRSGHNDISLALTIGADDYLVKPFNPADLVRRIRWLLLANDH